MTTKLTTFEEEKLREFDEIFGNEKYGLTQFIPTRNAIKSSDLANNYLPMVPVIDMKRSEKIISNKEMKQ